MPTPDQQILQLHIAIGNIANIIISIRYGNPDFHIQH